MKEIKHKIQYIGKNKSFTELWSKQNLSGLIRLTTWNKQQDFILISEGNIWIARFAAILVRFSHSIEKYFVINDPNFTNNTFFRKKKVYRIIL